MLAMVAGLIRLIGRNIMIWAILIAFAIWLLAEVVLRLVG